MKSKKAITIGMSILVLIAAIFIVYFLFLRNDQGESDVKLIEMKLPVATQNIVMNIDELKVEASGGDDFLMIKGWAFKKNVKEKSRELYLVFKSINDTLIYETEKGNILRPGVTSHFKLDGGVDNHGFEGQILLKDFKDTTYRLGIIIKDETGQYFIMSGKEISFSNGSVMLNDLKPKNNRVSIPFLPSTLQIRYNFEKFDFSENKLNVSGWAFIEKMNADSLKTYIVLRNAKTLATYSVVVDTRKGVTSYFKNLGLNLDLSGFSCYIDGGSLEKGKYQVCIYIVRGSKAGFIYSHNFVEIVK